jgi:TolB-like protein
MRHLPWSIVFLMLVQGVALGEALPTTQPAGTILVLPFVSPPSANFDWVGKGIQQNLIAELSPNLRGEAVSPENLPATEDAATALKAARENHAAVVMFGGTQLLDKQIRITGQVLDVGSAKLLGTLKATGAMDDLFRLEDTLAGQALRALPRTMLNLRGLAAASRGNRPQIIQLPSDAPLPMPSYGGGYSTTPLYARQPYALLEPPAPPYSPYSYSYPYRFYYPYYHLFSYGNGFCDPGFGVAFGFHTHWNSASHHSGHH